MREVIAHVIPWDGKWIVRREGTKAAPAYRTQKEAKAAALKVTNSAAMGHVVVHSRTGDYRLAGRHGFPRDYPVKLEPSVPMRDIRKAVAKVAVARLMAPQ